VRDVLAWMRLLSDPNDAAAVSRALVRPPIELRQSDLVRVIKIARRRGLDMVAALAAAIESPQVPPQARERIQRFQKLHAAADAALRAGRPDLFVRTVVGGERERAVTDAERPRDSPGGVSPGGDSPEGRSPESGEEEGHEDILGPTELLQATLQLMREEVMADVGRIARGLSELRLDTDVDIAHGMARYLELLKLTALLERPAGQGVAEALPEINARLQAAATSLQREVLQTSPLDAALLAAEQGEPVRVQAPPAHEQHSLAPFLPRIGHGLVLSASDIQTYRSCPLRYKYARVLRVPVEQTLNQRFGIVVHQVLERYHAAGASTLEELIELLHNAWRRAGLGDTQRERELQTLARSALTRYHARLHEQQALAQQDGAQQAQPAWFERPFSFVLGPHRVRGRVDRVDRLPDGGYELIDYKTSRPKTEAQLAEDVQLALYALAATEDWGLPAPRQSYYYVLDDLKVPLSPPSEDGHEWIERTVTQVGEGILEQQFEPTPSPAACAMCDYRIMCPVAIG
jgi:DNA helicase-2/ATP-dependent DNA helicase PcrA